MFLHPYKMPFFGGCGSENHPPQKTTRGGVNRPFFVWETLIADTSY